MAYHADRVKETTTTTGTGNLTTAGAVTNYQTFNTAFGLNVRFKYAIVDDTNNAWEVGEGYLSGSTTLVRDIVHASSNAGALVNFSAGTKNVFGDIAANEVQSKGRLLAQMMGMAMP